jgi:hypothetical protein
LILLANSRRGSFGRKLGKVRRLGEANPAFPDARHEFASSITVVSTFAATDFLVEPPDSWEITTLERAVALGYS